MRLNRNWIALMTNLVTIVMILMMTMIVTIIRISPQIALATAAEAGIEAVVIRSIIMIKWIPRTKTIISIFILNEMKMVKMVMTAELVGWRRLKLLSPLALLSKAQMMMITMVMMMVTMVMMMITMVMMMVTMVMTLTMKVRTVK